MPEKGRLHSDFGTLCCNHNFSYSSFSSVQPILLVNICTPNRLIYFCSFLLVPRRPAGPEGHSGDRTSQTGHPARPAHGTRPQERGQKRRGPSAPVAPPAAAATAAESSVRGAHTANPVAQVRREML